MITRVFLSYAARDANHRSLLVAATKAAGLPVRFVEMPNHVTDVRRRRVLCRTKLQQCDAALVLLSEQALVAPNVRLDVRNILAAALPCHAVMIHRVQRPAALPLPAGWDFVSMLPWRWPEMAALLQQLCVRDDALIAAG